MIDSNYALCKLKGANEKITITIDYKIKIPISDFTGYGIDKNGNSIPVFRKGEWAN